MNANGSVMSSDIVGSIKLKTMLSGMPELRLGLNDRVLFALTGRTRAASAYIHQSHVAYLSFTFKWMPLFVLCCVQVIKGRRWRWRMWSSTSVSVSHALRAIERSPSFLLTGSPSSCPTASTRMLVQYSTTLYSRQVLYTPCNILMTHMLLVFSGGM